MRRIAILLATVTALLLLSNIAFAQPSGYSYRIPIEIHNPNDYPVYQYTVIFDVNLAQYTKSNYNDIILTEVTESGEIELNYSKDVLGNGIVRIYAYLPEMPANETKQLYLYVGKENDTDHSIPKTAVLGKYLALRIKDAQLGGYNWTPEWDELSSCSKRYFTDGGRDIFDKFGYPRLRIGSSDPNLYMSPFDNCNPYTRTINGVHVRYENFALGYDTVSDPHDPPEEHQRIWVQEILTRCDDRGAYRYRYDVHGDMGYDSDTATYEIIYTTPYGTELTLHKLYDSDDDDKPSVWLLGFFGDGNQSETFTLRNHDDVKHEFDRTDALMPFTYLIFMGYMSDLDVTSWLDNALYFGEPCYVDEDITANIESPEYLYTLTITMPATVYRTHPVTIDIYYDGNQPLTLVTDWNEELNITQIDQNNYQATLVVDTSVPVGQHHIYAYVGDQVAQTITFNVEYGGTLVEPSVDFPEEVIKGLRYTILVPVTCGSNDNCSNIYVSLSSSDCTVLSDPVTIDFLEANATENVTLDFVCYHASPHSIMLTLSNPLGTITRTFEFNVIDPFNRINATIDSPEVTSPEANVPVTINAPGYEGNVTVSVLDKDLYVKYTTQATKVATDSYVATLDLSALDDGYYYILASGSNFSVMKVIIVSSSTFLNPFGIYVENGYGKPATLLDGEVNGDYIEYTIDVISLHNTPYTLDATSALRYGGLLQVSPHMISVFDSMTISNESNTVQYQISYDYYGGSLALVWHTSEGTLVLNPGDNIFKIRFKSPYVEILKSMVSETNDQHLLEFLNQMYSAHTLQDQLRIYMSVEQYLQTSIYGGIEVSVVLPPSVVQYQSAYGFIYVKNSTGNVDPETLECKVIDENGDHVADCTATRVETGVYKVALKTDTVGIFGISVTAHKGVYMTHSSAYYSVKAKYTPGEIAVTNFVVPPSGTTTILYTQDPVANVTIRLYDSSGNLLFQDVMTYNNDIGAFVYELNVGDRPDGDYIVVVSDNFGYSDRAIIRISSILEDILTSVSNIDTFLRNVIDPKLDSIQSDINTILDNQQNLYEAIEDVNAEIQQVLTVLDQLEQNMDQYHQETIDYLIEINQTAHQILNEVLYIKQKIDNVIIPKLNLMIDNQEDILGDLNDIKMMLDCNKPSAVCTHLNNIELLIHDLQDDLNTSTTEIVGRLDRIESKVDTLQDYADTLVDMLNCDYNYPTTSLCAKADVLRERIDMVYDEVLDVNTFLNTIYDYVRNDLTNEVISVGQKVEDINDYLHGDVWNKLVDIHAKVAGLYTEANRIYSLVEGHDAMVQAQLTNLMSYLEDLNTTLLTEINKAKNEILTHLDPIAQDVNSIYDNTNALIAYFHCSQPNEICSRLDAIYEETNDINSTVTDIRSQVSELRGIAITEFARINSKLDNIEANVTELQNMLDCQNYPNSPICLMLSDIKQSTNDIEDHLDELNQNMFDLADEIKEAINQRLSSAGGGGGGGPSAITPIKVVYKGGTVFVAVPDYVPPGTYKVDYVGELYRYVESPEPGSEINVENGIFELKLSPNAKGVVSGEIHLKARSRVYRVKVDIVADDRLNQKISASTLGNYLTIKIPEGGAEVIVKGPLANCVANQKMYFAKEGEYKVHLKCKADGVLEIIPKGLNQTTIQISVAQKPQIVSQNIDIVRTTVIPIATFIGLLFILSYLGLI